MTHLSPQISHLVAARPMSVTMGNAIRQLKLDISKTDIDLPEQDVNSLSLNKIEFTNHYIFPSQAKDALCQTIDNYIRDRIIIADQVIEETAGNKIKDGDVILTYARFVLPSHDTRFRLLLHPELTLRLTGLQWSRRSYLVPMRRAGNSR